MSQYLSDELKAWSAEIAKEKLSGKDAGRGLIRVLISTFIERWRHANIAIDESNLKIENARAAKNTISELINYLVENHGIDESEITKDELDVHRFKEIMEWTSKGARGPA